VTYIKTDVRFSEQVDAMVAQAVERTGGSTSWSTRRVWRPHEIVDMSDAEWDLQIDVSYAGRFCSPGDRPTVDQQG